MNQTSKLTSRPSISGPSILGRSRPPAFTPVKLRRRKDGWTHKVQCAFLAALYAHGSVAAAAKAVGRSRASAYKLRARPWAQSFAASWDKVLSGPCKGQRGPKPKRRINDWRKLTVEELFWRHEQGLLRPVIHRGQMCAIAQKPDNTALFRLLARLDKRHIQAQPRRQKKESESFLKPPLQCVRTRAQPCDERVQKPPNPSPRQSRQ